jgi:hypothetical protein
LDKRRLLAATASLLLASTIGAAAETGRNRRFGAGQSKGTTAKIKRTINRPDQWKGASTPYRMKTQRARLAIGQRQSGKSLAYV